MKLNQVVALEKSTKNRINDEVTKIYQRFQKPDLINGLIRAYTPVDEDGETKPTERKIVQVRVHDDLKRLASLETQLFNIVAARDFTNATVGATANIIVDGTALVENAPVPFLLWLEKQLTDMHTIIGKLPTLDPSERWTWSDTDNCYVAEAVEKISTKKVIRNHVLAPATDKHPAQVQPYNEDVKAGTWKETKFSGALPAKDVADMLERVEALQAAVKVAREEANSAPAVEPKIGAEVFKYIFSD